jgi:hypothetical protein
MNGLLRLPKLIPQAQLHCIKGLGFAWEYRSLPPIGQDLPSQRWKAAWAILAAMEGLEYLRVELVVINPADHIQWTTTEKQLLMPVRQVTRPKCIELILPFPGNPNLEESANIIIYRE